MMNRILIDKPLVFPFRFQCSTEKELDMLVFSIVNTATGAKQSCNLQDDNLNTFIYALLSDFQTGLRSVFWFMVLVSFVVGYMIGYWVHYSGVLK